MIFTRSSSPHLRQPRDTGALMRLVIYCALPGLLAQLIFFGWGVLVHLLLAVITAVVTEVVLLELRKKNFERAISDYSAILTALLLAISIPPLAPWWITVIGTFFAIAVVKQLYGGLGFNLFNPAMAAYVTLLISFPIQMTSWLPPMGLGQLGYGFIDAFSIIFTGFTLDGYDLIQLRTGVDGFTMATPLDTVKTALSTGLTYEEALTQPIFDGATGIGWFWVNLVYLFGGLILLKAGAINWHIPFSILASILFFSGILHLAGPDQYASPWFHLFSGGTMLGAFFIATDPVSASTTNKGRLIFGAFIGLWIVLIRNYGGYPDAIAFAVLIMNMAVPLIDYYTQPRVYGHTKGKS